MEASVLFSELGANLLTFYPMQKGYDWFAIIGIPVAILLNYPGRFPFTKFRLPGSNREQFAISLCVYFVVLLEYFIYFISKFYIVDFDTVTPERTHEVYLSRYWAYSAIDCFLACGGILLSFRLRSALHKYYVLVISFLFGLSSVNAWYFGIYVDINSVFQVYSQTLLVLYTAFLIMRSSTIYGLITDLGYSITCDWQYFGGLNKRRVDL